MVSNEYMPFHKQQLSVMDGGISNKESQLNPPPYDAGVHLATCNVTQQQLQGSYCNNSINNIVSVS